MPKLTSSARLSFATFLFISLAFVFIKVRQVKTVEPYIRDSYAISWDIYGYYLHLPATFIYKDPGIENRAWVDSLNAKYQPERPFYQVHPGQVNRAVNVYPTGLAVCNLPFFTVAHLYAKLSGYPADGLSPPYQWSVIFSALFYGILGCWLLRKLLLRYFSDGLASIVLLAIGFGTNLYYYATYENTMPHIHLFALDTLLVLATISWHERPRKRTALGIGLLLGLVTITRPSEIVWVLVPLLWNVTGWKSLKEKLRLLFRQWSHVLLLVSGMILIGSVQLIYWKYTSGHWMSNNHTEGFDFLRPFTLEVLFSYKKGWLLYTPLMVIAIAGLFFLYRKQRALFLPVLVFFIANLWFISSWECWWYAVTFGQRSFVQSYGLLALPLGFFLQSVFAKQLPRIAITAVLVLLIALNQFQVWQLRNGILDGSLMTKAAYWEAFGKTSKSPELAGLYEVDRGNLPPLDEVKHRYSERRLLLADSVRLDSVNVFGAAIKKEYCSLTEKDHLRMRMRADILVTPDLAGRPFYFVSTMIGSRDQAYGYSVAAFDTLQVRPGQWTTVSADFVTPYILHRDDILSVNIWNAGGSTLQFRNVELFVYEPRSK